MKAKKKKQIIEVISNLLKFLNICQPETVGNDFFFVIEI